MNSKYQDKQIHSYPGQPLNPSSGSYHVSCLALVLLNCRQLSGPGLYKATVDQGQPARVLGCGGGSQWIDQWVGLSEWVNRGVLET